MYWRRHQTMSDNGLTSARFSSLQLGSGSPMLNSFRLAGISFSIPDGRFRCFCSWIDGRPMCIYRLIVSLTHCFVERWDHFLGHSRSSSVLDTLSRGETVMFGENECGMLETMREGRAHSIFQYEWKDVAAPRWPRLAHLKWQTDASEKTEQI